MDTRYTTTQQVVKLIGSHTISKVTVKIGDLKRTKMVRTINLYYNNRTVQAIVELKNKYGLCGYCQGQLCPAGGRADMPRGSAATQPQHRDTGHRDSSEAAVSEAVDRVSFKGIK